MIEKRKREATKPKADPIRWTPLGSILSGVQVEVALIRDVVVIRGCRDRARAYEAEMNGETKTNTCILGHEAYALTEESVRAMLAMFPKKSKKERR